MSTIKGKISYSGHILKNYSNGFDILLRQLSKKHIDYVKLKNGMVILAGRKGLVLDEVEEIFIKGVYTPSLITLNSSSTVVDIGANVGIFALLMASKGIKNIYAVEPSPANIKLLKKNFQKNGFEVPTICKAAISDKSGKRNLYLEKYNAHNFLTNSKIILPDHRHIKVPTLTLASFLKKYKLTKVDLLKLDCEGSEGAIFKSTPINIWKRINQVTLEYHDHLSSLSHSQILKKLTPLGYRITVSSSMQPVGYIYAKR